MPLNLQSLKNQVLPSLPAMVADLGNPSAGQIAEALGVDRSTVSGWLRRGTAPRPAMLALFWATSWGTSALDADLFNAAQTAQAHRLAQASEVERLRRQLARVVSLADFGTANAPLFDAPTVADLLAAPVRRGMPRG